MKPENYIKQGIVEMLEADDETSPRRHLLETSERNITAHLRGSLRGIGHSFNRRKYQVDHEYNRAGMGDVPKDPWIECLEGKSSYVVPDVIVHLRGVEINEDLNANWLVIEVKKISNFNGVINDVKKKTQRDGLRHDLQKLNCFRECYKFRYQHVASIVFGKDSVWVSLDDEVRNNQFKKLLSILDLPKSDFDR